MYTSFQAARPNETVYVGSFTHLGYMRARFHASAIDQSRPLRRRYPWGAGFGRFAGVRTEGQVYLRTIAQDRRSTDRSTSFACTSGGSGTKAGLTLQPSSTGIDRIPG